jgi:hypothetical protein
MDENEVAEGAANAEMKSAQSELDAASASATTLALEQNRLALERVDSALDAEAMRMEMQQVQKKVERAHADVERAASRVKRELDRQMAQMRGDLEARKKRLALMQEGIETLGLYLSAAEGVIVVRDGERADALEPIIIRQMVLTMDEESGLFAEEDGMTAADIEAFDKWLLADPSHVDQVVPEQKCVVALVARWREREHGNPFTHESEDKVTHFLIRNGEALFRTTVNDFHAGEVLIPRGDEFINYFRQKKFNYTTHENEVITIRPGTREYALAMERSDARSRHFLRIGLVLQGLVDVPQQRPDLPDVFAPLHPAGINMLTDPSEHSEKCRIITDAEGGLESGEDTFLQWQKKINEALRPGMRIIGAFNGKPWAEANRWSHDKYYDGHSRVSPTGWNHPNPPSGVPLIISERRSDGGLLCRFERGEIYDPKMWVPSPDRPGWGHRGGTRKAKRRASVVIYPSDSFILAFDLIESSAQLRTFLSSRRNRREYRNLWPLIRSAMFAKAAEEKAEAPFEVMLSGVIARENEVTVAQAQAEIPELIRWFKLKNRWARPLTLQTMGSLEAAQKGEDTLLAENERTPGGRLTSSALAARTARLGLDTEVEYDEECYNQALEAQASTDLRGREHESLAVRMIVAEHARRQADRRRPVNDKLVAKLQTLHPEALLIARPRGSGYLVLLPAHAVENIWVHELDYNTKGELRERTDWRLLSSDRLSRWTICYEHPRFAKWNLNASEHDYLRGSEVNELIERFLSSKSAERTPMLISYRSPTSEERGQFMVWSMTEAELDDRRNEGYVAVTWQWKRGRDGKVELQQPYSIYQEHEHIWTLGPDQTIPWEGHYSAKYLGQIIWGPDAATLERFVARLLAYREQSKRERELDDQAHTLSETIADQWEALAVVKLYETFTEEVADARPGEWETYLKDNRPQWEWSYSHHYPHGDLGSVIHYLLEKGIDPMGLSAEKALERAREEGLPGSWKGFDRHVHEYPSTFPDEWADLIIGAEAVAEPTSTEEETLPEKDAEVVYKVSEGVDVLGPEEDEVERDEFDVLRDTFRDIRD